MNQVIMGSLYFLYNAASFHVNTVTQTDRDEKQLMCVVIMRQLSYESCQNEGVMRQKCNEKFRRAVTQQAHGTCVCACVYLGEITKG